MPRLPTVGLLLAGGSLLLAPAPGARAQSADLAAAPPPNATVYRISESDWTESFCAGATTKEATVPAGAWLEVPVSWIATDEATARANWKSLTYRVFEGDRPLQVPEGVSWQAMNVRVRCPNRTVAGAVLAPVLYMPPLTAERVLRLQYIADADVNDGWSTMRKGQTVTYTLKLHPASAKAAPARPAATAAAGAPALERAKAVLAAHDRAANSGSLDAVMANVADDFVGLAPGMPLVAGKAAFRAFYTEMLKATWNTPHYVEGAEQAGDVVVLHGVARGTMTPPGQAAVPVANNFLILLKPDATGAYRIWRAAFGDAGEGSSRR